MKRWSHKRAVRLVQQHELVLVPTAHPVKFCLRPEPLLLWYERMLALLGARCGRVACPR